MVKFGHLPSSAYESHETPPPRFFPPPLNEPGTNHEQTMNRGTFQQQTMNARGTPLLLPCFVQHCRAISGRTRHQPATICRTSQTVKKSAWWTRWFFEMWILSATAQSAGRYGAASYLERLNHVHILHHARALPRCRNWLQIFQRSRVHSSRNIRW